MSKIAERTLSKTWEYYFPAIQFAEDWNKNNRNRRVKSPFFKTLNTWRRAYSEEDLSQIVNGARRIMREAMNK